ncbi:hypothetical protein BG000_000269 [Podila horticola]|nr:hypothetical protein BG000_000269 [Podila horticola]
MEPTAATWVTLDHGTGSEPPLKLTESECKRIDHHDAVGMIGDEALMKYTFGLAAAQAAVLQEVNTRRHHLEQEFDQAWQAGLTHACELTCKMAFPWSWLAGSHSFVWTVPGPSNASGMRSSVNSVLTPSVVGLQANSFLGAPDSLDCTGLLESDDLEPSAPFFGNADLRGDRDTSAADPDRLAHAAEGGHEMDISQDDLMLAAVETTGGDVSDAKNMSRIELNDIPVNRWALTVFTPAAISDSKAGRVEFTAKTDKGQFVGVFWQADGLGLFPTLLNDVKTGDRLLVSGLLSMDVFVMNTTAGGRAAPGCRLNLRGTLFVRDRLPTEGSIEGCTLSLAKPRTTVARDRATVVSILDAQNAAMQGVDRLQNANLQRATKKILADVIKSDGGPSSSRSGQGSGSKRPFFDVLDDDGQEEEEETLGTKRMRMASPRLSVSSSRGTTFSGATVPGVTDDLSALFKSGFRPHSGGEVSETFDAGQAPAVTQQSAVAGATSTSSVLGDAQGSTSGSLASETLPAPVPGLSTKSGKSMTTTKKSGKSNTKTSASSFGNPDMMDLA